MLRQILSPEIGIVTKMDVNWGAAVGQSVPVKVWVKNNDWLPQTFKVTLKIMSAGKTYYTFSQSKSLYGGQTVGYSFKFTMPSLKTGAQVDLYAALYQVVFGTPKWIYGYTDTMVVTATPTIMPISYVPEILLYETYATHIADLYQFALKYAPGPYEDALAEAAKIGEEKGIQMVVEGLKPVHLGWTDYRLPVGDTVVNLRENVRVYPVGVFSNDPDFDSVKWYEGAKVTYLFDWFTKFVYYKEEKQAVMFPQPVFKTSFTFTVTSEVPKSYVDAWITAYVVLPATMKEMKITR